MIPQTMTYFTLDTNAPHDIDGASQESANRAKTIIDLLRPKTPSVELKRFGNLNDGGYVLANDLNGDDFLLSFGVCRCDCSPADEWCGQRPGRLNGRAGPECSGV